MHQLLAAEPGFPIARLTTAMHDGDNEQKFRFNRVQYAVREHACETAANVVIDYSPSGGRLDDSPNRIFDRVDKPVGKL